MNQQHLDQIKARAQASQAAYSKDHVNLTQVKAMAIFRQHAANDVLELIAEVERLSISEAVLTGIAAELKVMLTEALDEVERLRARVGLFERISCELVTEGNKNGYSLEFYNSLSELQEAISDDCEQRP